MQSHAPSAPALSGLRILDMATVVAAPFAATLAAEMGAEVVKLELPDGRDPLRTLQPVHDGQPVYWKVTNRGKKGISLDVRTPQGRDVLLQMLPGFDVLVENFRTGTMDRWGLDLQTLLRINPRLIVLRLTGFGQTGPYKDRPGFARVFEAMSGLAHITGEADGPPTHMNFPIGDMVAGLFGAVGILGEVIRLARDPEARGCEIDLSATEAVLRLLDPLAAELEVTGQGRSRAGNRATYTSPSNVYRSRDGRWFTLVASSDATFLRLCDAIGQPELAVDERFATNIARVAHGETLDALLVAWFLARPFADISCALDAQDVPYTPVYSVPDVMADPHFQARGAFVRIPDPDFGSLPAPAPVPRVPGRVVPAMRSGPSVGEHNEEVYGAFGFAPGDLKRLKAEGVI